MKNNRIYEGFIPSRLPHQELTPKNCFSKKCLTELIMYLTNDYRCCNLIFFDNFFNFWVDNFTPILELAIFYTLLGSINKFGNIDVADLLQALIKKRINKSKQIRNGFLATMLLISNTLLFAYFSGQQIQSTDFKMIAIISIRLFGV